MEDQANVQFQRSPQFSVIIPVRNEEQNIAKCLASLERMEFSSERFEVIVVDNGSTDHTRDVAAAFRERLPLRILERPNGYIAAVRNGGAALAQGTYLAFLDSDCEVFPDWLLQAALVLSANITGVFGSFYSIPQGSSWIARYWYEERDKKPFGQVPYLPAGNLFICRSLFKQLQGFDETIQTNEDYEFCQRARAAGYAITCVPELSVIHWGTPQSLSQFFRKHRWHGTHVFRVFLRNLPALCNLKPVLFAFYTLLCLLGVIVAFASLWIHGRIVWLLVSILAFITPSLVLSVAFRPRQSNPRWTGACALLLLYITYGIARATSLLGIHEDNCGARNDERKVARVEPNN